MESLRWWFRRPSPEAQAARLAGGRCPRFADQDHHVVLLQGLGGGRRLPIWIGREHAIDRQGAAGPQALLDELAEEARRQNPSEPAGS